MKNTILDALAKRRSLYALDKNIRLSSGEILEIVEKATLLVPSAYNSQSQRAVVLLGAEHDKLWGITRETLRKIVPAEDFSGTDEKMNLFQAAAGTVLFFEEMDTVKGLQAQFPEFADKFSMYSVQGNAMLELVVWVALEEEGLGASLQHYQPLIDDEVKKTWDIPESWSLIAQMVFGNPVAEAGAKEIKDVKERVLVRG